MPRPRRASVSASAESGTNRGRTLTERPGTHPDEAATAANARRARAFAQHLIDWQRFHGRHDLPWQRTRDPYRIWIAEVMLQQTQVTTVLRYYDRFLEAFPDVASLARAPLDSVLAPWSGLGYYRRAHHLHAAAQVVIAKHGGRFPGDAATLRTLPGIGRSTAAAVAAFASGERGAILDGNVKRVLARHRGIDGWPGSPAVEARLWAIAEALLPRARGDAPIAVYTQALMDLGSLVCTRARPHCERCPVATDCVARRDNRVDALPASKPHAVIPARALRVLLVERGGRVALERRPKIGIWAGLWSLPELALDDDVAAIVAARFGAVPLTVVALPTIEHRLTHRALTLHPLRVELPPTSGAFAAGGTPAGRVVEEAVLARPYAGATKVAEVESVSWFTLGEAMAVALPAPILSLLQAHALRRKGALAAIMC